MENMPPDIDLMSTLVMPYFLTEGQLKVFIGISCWLYMSYIASCTFPLRNLFHDLMTMDILQFAISWIWELSQHGADSNTPNL